MFYKGELVRECRAKIVDDGRVILRLYILHILEVRCVYCTWILRKLLYQQ